jgi:iron-sulfur cluster repair protein YtfE (RIC family)
MSLSRIALKNLLSADTLTRDLLRIRPLALEVMERRGIRPWPVMDRPLSQLFLDKREGALQDFLDEISALPVPAADSRWEDLPVFYLIDYVTHQHREFLLNDIPDIHYLFDMLVLTDSEYVPALKSLQADFQAFCQDYHHHMDEEETQIFPRILRCEASLKDSSVHPEFNSGSVQIFVATRSARLVHRTETSMAEMVERAAKVVSDLGLPSPEGGNLQALLAHFLQRLRAHSHLETQRLFPAGLELERTLYNLSIGGKLATRRVRGPLDSGVIRLRPV